MAADKPIRRYRVDTIGALKFTKYKFVDHDAGKIAYSCDIPIYSVGTKKMDVTMCAGESMEDPIIGVTKADQLGSGGVTWGLGNPDSVDAVWDKMSRGKRSAINNFLLSVELPGSTGERRNFECRGTHDVPMGAFKKLYCDHLKLVDSDSGKVVARFIHKSPWMHYLEKGDIEIYGECGGEVWDRIVILTCFGIRSLFNADRGGGS